MSLIIMEWRYKGGNRGKGPDQKVNGVQVACFSVVERKVKVSEDQVSIDNYDPQMHWENIQNESVAVEDPQNIFACHIPIDPEDEVCVVCLKYRYNKNWGNFTDEEYVPMINNNGRFKRDDSRWATKNIVPLDQFKPNTRFMQTHKLHTNIHTDEWICAFLPPHWILNTNRKFHISQWTNYTKFKSRPNEYRATRVHLPSIQALHNKRNRKS